MGPAMLWEISLLQKCSLQGDSVAKDRWTKGFICPELLQYSSLWILELNVPLGVGAGSFLLAVTTNHQILRPEMSLGVDDVR